jgi:hypothetical protein
MASVHDSDSFLCKWVLFIIIVQIAINLDMISGTFWTYFVSILDRSVKLNYCNSGLIAEWSFVSIFRCFKILPLAFVSTRAKTTKSFDVLLLVHRQLWVLRQLSTLPHHVNLPISVAAAAT